MVEINGLDSLKITFESQWLLKTVHNAEHFLSILNSLITLLQQICNIFAILIYSEREICIFTTYPQAAQQFSTWKPEFIINQLVDNNIRNLLKFTTIWIFSRLFSYWELLIRRNTLTRPNRLLVVFWKNGRENGAVEKSGFLFSWKRHNFLT